MIDRDLHCRDDSRVIIIYKYYSILKVHAAYDPVKLTRDTKNLSNSDFEIWYKRLVGQKPNVCHCHTHTHTQHIRINVHE